MCPTRQARRNGHTGGGDRRAWQLVIGRLERCDRRILPKLLGRVGGGDRSALATVFGCLGRLDRRANRYPSTRRPERINPFQ